MNESIVWNVDSTPVRIDNPIRYFTDQYRKSKKRPYRLEVTYMRLPLDDILELIRGGYDLDLTNHAYLLDQAIKENDYSVVDYLYRCYPTTMIFSASMASTSPDIFSLLRGHFNEVHVIDDIRYHTIDISTIMRVIDNLDINDPLKVTINEETDLLRRYAKVLNRPISLTIEDENEFRRSDGYNPDPYIDRFFLDADLSSMDYDNQRWLLTMVIRDGNYGFARHILDSTIMIESDISIDPIGLAGLKCLLDLSEEYPELIINDELHLIVQLINIDYYLQYCMDEKYWKKLDEVEFNYAKITNPNAMRTLKGKVQDCNYYIEMIKTAILDGKNKTAQSLFVLCENVIPITDNIDSDNILYLIDVIGDNRLDLSIIGLLIKLHQNKLINLRGYNNTHPYVQFIIDRLPVNMSMKVKNARNYM